MTHKNEFTTASSDAIIKVLCKRLDDIRLSRNLSQVDLATEAGVSRSTITRMADGKATSLDSFVRVMMALGLTDHLEAMLPDPEVRPVERVRLAGTERQRASRKKQEAADWQWGDSSK